MRIRRSNQESQRDGGYLDGRVLVATPTIRDERFARAVIYMCAHSSEGAMGIVINQPAPHISFSDLLVQLQVIPAANLIELAPDAAPIRVLKGGPVQTERGFVLHTDDFFLKDSTLPIDAGICLTATLDILKAIARGQGPKSAVLALGYAGWSQGQLESEMEANGWLDCDADPELVFGADAERKYPLALRKIGIDPGMLSSLSSDAGHA
jgi:putative transcriptional regulator